MSRDSSPEWVAPSAPPAQVPDGPLVGGSAGPPGPSGSGSHPAPVWGSPPPSKGPNRAVLFGGLALVVAAAAAVLGVVLMSDDSSSDDDTEAGSDEDSSENRDDESSNDDSEVRSPDDGTSDDSPSGERPDDSPAADPPDVDDLLPGERFVDPQESYTMHVDPAWPENHGVGVAEIESWTISEPNRGFGANINVMTQLFAGDLSAYMDVSTQGVENFMEGGTLVDDRIIDGTAGQELGIMVYTGSMGGQDLHFAVVFFVDGEHAVVATLTALPEDFADLFDEVGPYLLTLRSVKVDEL